MRAADTARQESEKRMERLTDTKGLCLSCRHWYQAPDRRTWGKCMQMVATGRATRGFLCRYDAGCDKHESKD